MPDSAKSVTQTDSEFLHDVAARVWRFATPNMGFDQGDTDRLYRIARDLSRAAPPAMDREAVGLVEQVKRALKELDEEGDQYTDAGMEDVYYRWPTIRHALSTLSADAIRQGEGLPQSFVTLVIAAREAFDTGLLPQDEQGALDKALEPFASSVPYANEPATPASHASDGGKA